MSEINDKVTKEEEDLILLMRDRGYDKDQAIGILLMSVEYGVINKTIKYMKDNTTVSEVEMFEYLYSLIGIDTDEDEE